jgi:hypothetical protein|tara:strand:- start:410 stop:568 length:159 start_codon:yes stop_codon:yes gene_type:complete
MLKSLYLAACANWNLADKRSMWILDKPSEYIFDLVEGSEVMNLLGALLDLPD